MKRYKAWKRHPPSSRKASSGPKFVQSNFWTFKIKSFNVFQCHATCAAIFLKRVTWWLISGERGWGAGAIAGATTPGGLKIGWWPCVSRASNLYNILYIYITDINCIQQYWISRGLSRSGCRTFGTSSIFIELSPLKGSFSKISSILYSTQSSYIILHGLFELSCRILLHPFMLAYVTSHIS